MKLTDTIRGQYQIDKVSLNAKGHLQVNFQRRNDESYIWYNKMTSDSWYTITSDFAFNLRQVKFILLQRMGLDDYYAEDQLSFNSIAWKRETNGVVEMIFSCDLKLENSMSNMTLKLKGVYLPHPRVDQQDWSIMDLNKVHQDMVRIIYDEALKFVLGERGEAQTNLFSASIKQQLEDTFGDD
jgi:hypothetical protein